MGKSDKREYSELEKASFKNGMDKAKKKAAKEIAALKAENDKLKKVNSKLNGFKSGVEAVNR